MKHYHVLPAVLICLVFLLPTTITGVSSGNPSDSQTEDPPAAQAEKVSPMKREMQEILLRERADLEILVQRLAAIDDRIAALEVQREISDRKFLTQIELIEAQGRFAKENGQTELAEEAERAVARLKERLKQRQINQGGE